MTAITRFYFWKWLTDSPEQGPVTITEELENKDENATQADELEAGEEKDKSGFLNRFKKTDTKKNKSVVI